MTRSTTTRSERLLKVLSDYSRVFVVMHDNPDPDAMASGWAVMTLVKEKLGVPARLVGGGDIVRAENREFVKLLKPPVELIGSLDVPWLDDNGHGDDMGEDAEFDHSAWDDRDVNGHSDGAAVLVDCGPSAANHLLSNSPVQAVAVIDHHKGQVKSRQLPFQDIRPRVAASATIAASYLREQDLVPCENLATALTYAMRTETQGGESGHSRLDRSIIAWLAPMANPERLSEIENAPLPREYYADLVLALQNTFTYDNAALCFLPSAQSAEIVGEVADLLTRCESIDMVLCAAVVGADLMLSVRTARTAGNAAELVRQVVDGLGHGGGHQHRAGGKIPKVGVCQAGIDQVHNELRARWLAACSVERQRGTRLIAKRDIVSNL